VRLAWALAAASFVWLALLAGGASCAPDGASWFCDAIFRFCSYVCHQRPERSFHWGAQAWPVCARCLGLYVAAPAGAALAIVARAPVSFPGGGRNLVVLCGAAIPTFLTWMLEHAAGMMMSNALRFAAALPLGAVVAWVLVRTARNPA
jgi:uncharacterized membrane protein